MCRQILLNQEKNGHTYNDDEVANIKRLLPIRSEAELEHIHQEMLREEFKTNLVS